MVEEEEEQIKNNNQDDNRRSKRNTKVKEDDGNNCKNKTDDDNNNIILCTDQCHDNPSANNNGIYVMDGGIQKSRWATRSPRYVDFCLPRT